MLGVRVMTDEAQAPIEFISDESVAEQIVTPIVNDISSPTLSMQTRGGNVAEVTNFLSSPGVDEIDDGVYLVSEAQSLNGSLYQIFFYEAGAIQVILNDEDLTFARRQAERELRSLVSNSEIILCSLVVDVLVPAWLSQQLGVDYSGINFGLSFCPSGIDFNDL